MKHEELIQRFVDQELSAAERIQFVVALGRDHELRERVLALEQVVLDAATLPRPAVPAGFAARVLEQTTAIKHNQPASVLLPPEGGSHRVAVVASTFRWKMRRAIDALWAPRALQWNLASAAALACLALVAVGALVATTLKQQPPAAADATPPGAPAGPVLVRLVVVQPGARAVQAAGDFNGWNPTRTPLEQAADGAWTVTIPLEPGRYEYQFVVDGEHWIGDPFAVEQNDDGFGSRNAVLDVRPPAEAL